MLLDDEEYEKMWEEREKKALLIAVAIGIGIPILYILGHFFFGA